jgi:RNA polymerase sigma-70 factor (ECF subfamily)
LTALEKPIVSTLSPEFETLFRENYELVYRAAQSITGNTADAEDVLQTLFLRLFRREFQIYGNLKGYLYRAAINLSLDLARSRKREAQTGTAYNSGTRFASTREADLQEWFQSALQKMSTREAEVFVLHHLEGYANAEIASLLGTTRGTVAVTLFRARSYLRKSIRKHFGDSL